MGECTDDSNVDLHTIVKIRQVWTKLTPFEICYYMRGLRGQFLLVLQQRYHFTAQQADEALRVIEHSTRHQLVPATDPPQHESR